MIDFLHNILGRWTPFVILGVIGIGFILMWVFGFNFG